MKNNDIKKRKKMLLKELIQSKDKHLDIAMSILKANNSQLCVLDFWAVAAIHRSINVIKGFCNLVKHNNFICAAALLRLQLDNCLRFHACFLVSDPNEFAIKVMKGEHINKQEDIQGKKMTDAYLTKKVSEIYPWVSELYKFASGYIHLSGKHIFNVIKAKPEEEGSAQMIIGEGDSFVTDKDYLNLIIAFRKTTDLFIAQIEGWAVTKDKVKIRPF